MGIPVKQHLPCRDCGSSDALTVYRKDENDDLFSICHKCEAKRFKLEDVVLEAESVVVPFVPAVGKVSAIPKRDITQDPCRYYGVTRDGDTISFPYGEAGAKKRLLSEKKFWVEGKLTQLFGQDKFSQGGRFVTVCEGELDALSAFQMTGGRHPFVSVPNGATEAVRACQRHFEWLDSFECVVVCFDDDEPGRKAAQEVAELFSHKAKVFKHKPGFKDANDYIMQGKTHDFVKAWWDAEDYAPDGIINGASLWDVVSKPLEQSLATYPFQQLNDYTYGIRKSELVMITAGTGLGKSQFMRELVHHVFKTTDENIGLLFLEEDTRRTGLGVMSVEANLPLHLPNNGATMEELKNAYDSTLGSGRFHLFAHFGSLGVDNIVARVRYMAKARSCGFVFLDHVSIVVSAGVVGDERKALDEIMTKLRMLVQETGIALVCVSHLKRPEGRGHEEGAATSLGQLRGSGGIGQLSDIVIGLERNGQAEDQEERHTTRLRVLKNRFSGLTGPAGEARYNLETGRMTEIKQEEL